MSTEFIKAAAVAKRQIGAIDILPNLLLTTLAITALPIGKQLSTSAPPLKAPVQCEQPQNLLPTGINLPPATSQLTASAPQARYNTSAPLLISPPSAPADPAVLSLFDSAPRVNYSPPVDIFSTALLLGIRTPPQVQFLSASAPTVSYQPQVDLSPNNTIAIPVPAAVPLPLAAVRWDASAPQIKIDSFGHLAVSVIASPIVAAPFIPTLHHTPQQLKGAIEPDQTIQNTLLLGIAANPAVQSLSASAPSVETKYTPQVDRYPNLSIPFPATPNVLQLSASAPSVETKYTPQVDVYVNRTIPIALPPPTIQHSASAPSIETKYTPQVDVYVNRAIPIILPQIVPLPLGLPLDAELGKRIQPLNIPADFQAPNLSLSLLHSVNVVPNVIGMYYYEAQLALLGAGIRIAPPIWVLAAGVVNLTADSTVPTADTSMVTADQNQSSVANPVLPGYVVGQSLAPGSTFGQVQPQVLITVIGFPVVLQPNTVIPVP